MTSYVAVEFNDMHGAPLAVLGVLDTKPLLDTELIKNLLDILGVRISAELQRARLEEELSLSEKRYRTLAETANDTIISVDGQIYFVCKPYRPENVRLHLGRIDRSIPDRSDAARCQ